jgi:hypothetical protein
LFKNKLAGMTVPTQINTSRGDLLIFFTQSINGADPTKNETVSSLFWFQKDQPGVWNELKKNYLRAGAKGSALCDQFDGIPA